MFPSVSDHLIKPRCGTFDYTRICLITLKLPKLVLKSPVSNLSSFKQPLIFSRHKMYLNIRGIKCHLLPQRLTASQSHGPANQCQVRNRGPSHEFQEKTVCSSFSPLPSPPGCFHILTHEPCLPTSKALLCTTPSSAANEGASPATAFEVSLKVRSDRLLKVNMLLTFPSIPGTVQ